MTLMYEKNFASKAARQTARRQFGRRRPLSRAGRIDQNPDRPAGALHLVDHRGRGGSIGAIGGDAEDAGQQAAGALDVLLRPGADRDPRALGQKRLGAGEPDPLGTARDENDFAFETEVHGTDLRSRLHGSP